MSKAYLPSPDVQKIILMFLKWSVFDAPIPVHNTHFDMVARITGDIRQGQAPFGEDGVIRTWLAIYDLTNGDAAKYPIDLWIETNFEDVNEIGDPLMRDVALCWSMPPHPFYHPGRADSGVWPKEVPFLWYPDDYEWSH